MSKIYPIKMNLAYILALFNANNKMSFIKNGSEYVLFEVYSLKNAKQLEDLFLSKTETKRNIITNNQGKKPLVMSAEFSDNSIRNMWRFKIFQRGSKGIILDTFQTVDSIPIELQTLLRPLEESFIKSSDINKVYTYFDKKLRDYMHNVHLLGVDDLKFYLKKDYLTNFEKQQVVLTNIFYENNYDFYTERIDDYVTSVKARESNEKITEIISLCKKLIAKHSAIDELLNKKGEVGKYSEADQEKSWFVLLFEKKFGLKLIKV